MSMLPHASNYRDSDDHQPHRLEHTGNGEWACNCLECSPIVNLASVRQEQQIARLDQELLAHEQLLWALSEHAAAMAVRFDSGLLTSAAFNILAARGRIVAALKALDRIEVLS